MNVTSFNINITSSQLDKMTQFYGETLGLKQDPFSMGYEVAGGVHLHLDSHSDISGPTKEPARVLVNFMVDDLAAEQAALEAKGVKFIRTAGVEAWGGKISTFLDPDGNYLQLMEYHPEAAGTDAPS